MGDEKPQITIKDVAPKLPQWFHDDYVNLFNFIGFTLLLANGGWLIHIWILESHRQTTWVPPWVNLLFFLVVAYGILRLMPGLPYINWKDEIVLITGGGTGLGAELALTLSKRTKVVVLTIQPPSYPDDIPNIFSYNCDVTDRAAVAATAALIRKRVGDPTIIVNNAGVVKGKLLLDLTAADILNTFCVNAIAPFFVIQEFLPSMLRKRHGHIVNISSVLGLLGTAQMTDYCASKAALVSMHESFRKELEYRYKTPEIRTTLVLPGHIHTALFKSSLLPIGFLGRLLPSLQPSDVVDAILTTMHGGAGALENTVVRVPKMTQTARILGPFAALMWLPLARITDWLSGAHWAMKPYGPSPDAGQRLQAERQKLKESQGSTASGSTSVANGNGVVVPARK